MRNLSRNIRSVAKGNNLFPATVLDVTGKTATVRMSKAGAIYRNLHYVGGPLSVGDNVHVDFSTDTPMIKAPSYQQEYKEDYEYEEVTLYDSGEGIILEYPDMSRLYYPVTVAGFNGAVENSTDHSKIIIPECVLTSGSAGHFYPVPDYIKVIGAGRDSTVMNGIMQMGSYTELSNLTVYRHYDTSDLVKCVRGPLTGDLTINSCDIYAINCVSSGSSYGLLLYGGTTRAYDSAIFGEGLGDAYGIADGVGEVYLYSCSVYGDDGKYKYGTSVFESNVVEGQGISVCIDLEIYNADSVYNAHINNPNEFSRTLIDATDLSRYDAPYFKDETAIGEYFSWQQAFSTNFVYSASAVSKSLTRYEWGHTSGSAMQIGSDPIDDISICVTEEDIVWVLYYDYNNPGDGSDVDVRLKRFNCETEGETTIKSWSAPVHVYQTPEGRNTWLTCIVYNRKEYLVGMFTKANHIDEVPNYKDHDLIAFVYDVEEELFAVDAEVPHSSLTGMAFSGDSGNFVATGSCVALLSSGHPQYYYNGFNVHSVDLSTMSTSFDYIENTIEESPEVYEIGANRFDDEIFLTSSDWEINGEDQILSLNLSSMTITVVVEDTFAGFIQGDLYVYAVYDDGVKSLPDLSSVTSVLGTYARVVDDDDDRIWCYINNSSVITGKSIVGAGDKTITIDNTGEYDAIYLCHNCIIMRKVDSFYYYL